MVAAGVIKAERFIVTYESLVTSQPYLSRLVVVRIEDVEAQKAVVKQHIISDLMLQTLRPFQVQEFTEALVLDMSAQGVRELLYNIN